MTPGEESGTVVRQVVTDPRQLATALWLSPLVLFCLIALAAHRLVDALRAA